jgi:hypothetical protein
VIGEPAKSEYVENYRSHIELFQIYDPPEHWEELYRCDGVPDNEKSQCTLSTAPELKKWVGQQFYIACPNREVQTVVVNEIFAYHWGHDWHVLGYLDIKIPFGELCVASKERKKIGSGLAMATIDSPDILGNIHSQVQTQRTVPIQKQMRVYLDENLPGLESEQQIRLQDIQIVPINHPKAAYLGTLQLDFPQRKDVSGYGELYLIDSEGRLIKAFSSGPLCCSESYGFLSWNCKRLHGVGDLDGDGLTDFLVDDLGADGSFFGMGWILLHLSSSPKPLQLSVWYGG